MSLHNTWFIEEYKKLQLEKPRIALVSVNSENSEYTTYASFNKNCYLCFGVHYSEDCYYMGYSVNNTSCADCEDVEKSELMYECMLCEKCYNCNFGMYLIACSDCDFCWDLANCNNCFLCTGTQNKNYCIANEQLSREAYFEKRKFLLKQFSTKELLQKLNNEVRQKFPQRAVFQKNCENCIGPDLRNCKNTFFSFAAKNAEDCIYASPHINNVKDGVDIECIAATQTEVIYNSIGASGVHNVFCSLITWFSHDIFYSEQIWNSNHCLGCIARNHAEYEILNQKYSKETWHKKFEEIKAQLLKENLWGKMWIPSTYPYKDTLAALYYA